MATGIKEAGILKESTRGIDRREKR